MQLKRLLSSAGALLLGLTGCASGIESPPPGAVPGPALWEVADEDTKIYLFGTVHALPQGKNWFDGRIEQAFAASDELVTEIDLAQATASAQSLAGAAQLPEGQTLRQLMAPDKRQAYEASLVALGLPVEALDKVEPWFAAMTLSYLPLARRGYESQSGVELSLAGRAGEGKKRGALETIEQQIALFDTMPMDAQLAFLDEVVTAMPESGSTLDAMVADWIEGDADGLAKLLNAELDNPALYQRLLIDRNANWAEWIDKRLEQPGTVFVAVGAGHLAGQGSVQDQLRKRGIRARRVWQ